MEKSTLGLSNAPNSGRRGGNSSIPKSRAKESGFSASADFYALLAFCLLTRTQSYALLAVCLLTRIQRLFVLVYWFTLHKASEDEPGDGNEGNGSLQCA